MNGLEKLVPPLELCKQIPAGEFADSALVWGFPADDGCDFFENHSEKNAILFATEDYGMWRQVAPAPTLEDIAAKTPGGIEVNFDEKFVESVDFECGGESAHEYWTDKENAATAALRLWLRIRKAEREYHE